MNEAPGQNNFDYYNFEELSGEERDLIEEARRASAASYSPYSNFKVGAAVLLTVGTVNDCTIRQ
ncbi:MAG: hypothetical protein AAFN93_10630 [Bacteroidota bacterium]